MQFALTAAVFDSALTVVADVARLCGLPPETARQEIRCGIGCADVVDKPNRQHSTVHAHKDDSGRVRFATRTENDSQLNASVRPDCGAPAAVWSNSTTTQIRRRKSVCACCLAI